MRVGVKPLLPRPADNAIEKHPAWAAPISSSGLVPGAPSKRVRNEYAPLNAPLPSFIVPLPSFRLPSQTASAVLVAMWCLLVGLNVRWRMVAGRRGRASDTHITGTD